MEGNTLDKIVLKGGTTLQANRDYTWDAGSGSGPATLSFPGTYLEARAEGAHVFELHYHPLEVPMPGGGTRVLNIDVEVRERIYVESGTDVVALEHNPTVPEIEEAINTALDTASADTVRVMGKHSDADSTLTIRIPADKTLVWEADYAGSGGNDIADLALINLLCHSEERGSGEMRVREKGQITTSGTFSYRPSVTVRDSVKLDVGKTDGPAIRKTSLINPNPNVVELYDDSELNLEEAEVSGDLSANNNSTVNIEDSELRGSLTANNNSTVNIIEDSEISGTASTNLSANNNSTVNIQKSKIGVTLNTRNNTTVNIMGSVVVAGSGVRIHDSSTMNIKDTRITCPGGTNSAQYAIMMSDTASLQLTGGTVENSSSTLSQNVIRLAGNNANQKPFLYLAGGTEIVAGGISVDTSGGHTDSIAVYKDADADADKFGDGFEEAVNLFPLNYHALATDDGTTYTYSIFPPRVRVTASFARGLEIGEVIATSTGDAPTYTAPRGNQLTFMGAFDTGEDGLTLDIRGSLGPARFPVEFSTDPFGLNLALTPPTGEIRLQGQNSPEPHTFSQLPRSQRPTLALQDSVEISISGTDGFGEDLQNTDIHYHRAGTRQSETDLRALPESAWTPYTGPIPHSDPARTYLYARLSDGQNQKSHIGTDGFFAYPAATADETSFRFRKNMDEDDVVVAVDLRGNGFQAVRLDGTPLTPGDAYTWDQAGGILSIPAAYLYALPPDTYVFELWYGLPDVTIEAGDDPVLEISVTVLEAIYVDDGTEVVELPDPTVPAIQTAINEALDAGGTATVTVSGKHGGADSTLTIGIPQDKTLVWEADYAGSRAGGTLIDLRRHPEEGGSGGMLVQGKGQITNSGFALAITMTVRDSVKLGVGKTDGPAIAATSSVGNNAVVLHNDSGLNMKGAVVNGNVAANNNTTINIEESKLSGQLTANQDSTVNIEGSELSGGLTANQDSTVTIEDSELSGQLIAIQDSTVNIRDSELGGVYTYGNSTTNIENTKVIHGGEPESYYAIFMGDTAALLLKGGKVENKSSTYPQNAIRLDGSSADQKPFLYLEGDTAIIPGGISVDTSGHVDSVAVYKEDADAVKFGDGFEEGTNLFRLDEDPVLTTDPDTSTPYAYAGGPANAHPGTVTAVFLPGLEEKGLPGLDIRATAADPATATHAFRGNNITFTGEYDHADIGLDINGTLAEGRLPVAFGVAGIGVNINTPTAALEWVTRPADITYGDGPLAEPGPVARWVDDGVIAGSIVYAYAGNMGNGMPYGPSAEPPTNPGSYSVTATLISTSHRGSIEADFIIWPGESLSWNADGEAHDKEWNGNTRASIKTYPTLSGMINNDDVTADAGAATLTFASADVGSHAVTAAGFGIEGPDAWKYRDPAGQPIFKDAKITVSRSLRVSDISLSPAYQTVQKAGGKLTLSLQTDLVPGNEALPMGAVEWDWDKTAFDLQEQTDDKSATLALDVSAGAVAGKSYRIDATLTAADGNTYKSFAEVYVHAGDGGVDDLNAFDFTLLETTLRLNRARTDGVLLPVKVAHTGDGGMRALSGGQGTNKLLSDIIDEHGVGLYTDYGNPAKQKRLDPETIRIAPSTRDPRALELFAEPGAKSARNVAVVVGGKKGGVEPRPIGSINITVAESYPKIRVSASSNLNLFAPEAGMTFTATAADGSTVTVEDVTPTGSNAGMVEKVGKDGLKLIPDTAKKNKSVGVDLTLKLDNYRSPAKPGKKNPDGNVLRSSVRIVDSVPKPRLSPATVLAELELPFSVAVQGVDPTQIEKIKFQERELSGQALKDALDTENGMLTLTATQAAAKFPVEFSLKDVKDVQPERWIGANLRVNAANMEKATKLRTPTKSVSIHQAYQTGEIVRIELLPQVATVFFADSPDSDLDVEIPGDIRDLVKPTVKDNTVILEKIGVDNLKPGTYDIKMTPSRDIPRFAKISPLTYKLRVTNATTASVTLSQKGRLNVAVADSAVAVTVRPNGTASKLKNVTLGGVHEELFEATPTGDFTFEIKAKPAAVDAKNADHGKRIIPGVRYTLGGLEIEMENGEKMSPARALVITPTTTVARGNRSPASLTLYTSTPAVGEALNLSLSGTGVTLGEARLEQKRLDSFKFKDSLEGKEAVDGFELVRSGRDAWLVGFEGGRVPVVLNKQQTAEMALKKSYTLRVEVWADGTYVLEDEKPVALRDDSGRARTKPRMLNVRVNVR